MNLLVVHLSDMHLRAADDLVIAKISRIPDAVRNLEASFEKCIVAVSGDVAFSGQDHQFSIALDTLVVLSERLQGELRLPEAPVFVLVPGNHDCHLSPPQTVRDQIIASTLKGDLSQVDPSVVELCTGVQHNFFTFAALLDSGPPAGASRLTWTTTVPVGARSVRISCINTAWVSRMNETQGQMFFPESDLPRDRGDADLSIVMFHHPYNWLEATNSRAFRKQVESVADLVLTGHEHDFTLRFQTNALGEGNAYLEGGALQEPGTDASAFNACVFDLDKRLQRVISFDWAGDHYRQANGTNGWQQYQMAQLEESRLFAVSSGMQDFLEDAGAVLKHPVAGDLKLGDIFVYPDLRQVRYDRKGNAQTLRGENIVRELDANPHLLITGPDKCGKSTLSKQVYADLHAHGFVPVYLSGKEVKWRKRADVPASIDDAYRRQYAPEHLERFHQHDRKLKAVVIDDFHRLTTSGMHRRDFMEELGGHVGAIVLFAHDIASQLGDLTEAGPLGGPSGDYIQYGILPFGHVRRNEMVERWLALDPTAAEVPVDFSRKVIAIKRMMDTAIGTNFVPSYPVFLVPVLQAFEYSQPVDVSASTYGYFYELLIRNALAKDVSREEFDIYIHYLAFVANAMHVRGVGWLREEELRDIHREFEQERILRLPFVDAMARLTKQQVLVSGERGYGFKYPYYAYYFIAVFLRDHLDEGAVRARVSTLTKRLDDEDSANILLFLAHVSKSAFIVDEMLLRAQECLARFEKERLERKMGTASTIERGLIEVAVSEMPGRENRVAMWERLDQEQASDAAARGDETDAFLAEIGTAFRTIQILGQMLKSFPGSMDGAHKLALARNCRDIGMRLLGAIVTTIDEAKESLVAAAVESLREEFPEINVEQLRDKVSEAFFALFHLASFGIVRRVAVALGSPHLSELYDKVAEEEGSPFVTLVRTSLRLDHSKGFPMEAVMHAHEALKDNPLAHLGLKRIVSLHFHLFDEPVMVRQRACAVLGIPLRPTISMGGRTKLISGSKEASDSGKEVVPKVED